jgi:hypothetical protein
MIAVCAVCVWGGGVIQGCLSLLVVKGPMAVQAVDSGDNDGGVIMAMWPELQVCLKKKGCTACHVPCLLRQAYSNKQKSEVRAQHGAPVHPVTTGAAATWLSNIMSSL